ncbi:MAG: peptidoglycan DD-metalloendopeptidase family protein, partial [Pseudomonadota bacterium]|nr:peptidoglycan DD-metalloendopeptidase family protein [Pseudomonadota bacterium]
LNALMGYRAVERRRMMQQSESVNARLAALNRKAKSLRELFSNFAKEKRDEDVARNGKETSPTQQLTTEQPSRQAGPIARNPARGSMNQPAQGRVIEGFGQDTGTGSSAKGATFRTRYRAQVVAPFDGKVVFVGPFKGYGQILIIQHGDAYHTLLAGMQRVDATLGQRLLAGEPIGIMGTQEDGARLYVEVRRKGQPVNPLPWFTAANDKVRG